jgi:signal peptidase I
VVAVWVRDLLVSLAISAFIIIFLYQPVKVEGTSMMPGLEDQERIFVNKFVYRWEPIQRGDIIVFRYPRDTSKSYIKRVIGIAGDHIRIENWPSLRERRGLSTKTMFPPITRTPALTARLWFRPTASSSSATIAAMSNDSRDFGTVERTLHLRQSRLRILADGKAGKTAVDPTKMSS